MAIVRDFPLFPLGLVALPSELVPLHIFEERYKAMIARCLEEESEFGIVWMADDGLRPIGCACEIAEVLEQLPDGRINLIARGTRPFRIEERQEELPYPAGSGRVPRRPRGGVGHRGRGDARTRRTPSSCSRPPTARPNPDEIGEMTAYEMAATVEFGLDAKQGLLDLRSEAARLKLVTRLFRAALKRLDFVERAQARARSNGKVHFSGELRPAAAPHARAGHRGGVAAVVGGGRRGRRRGASSSSAISGSSAWAAASSGV